MSGDLLESALKKLPERLAEKYVPFSVVVAEELAAELAESVREALKPKAFRTLTFESAGVEVDGVKSVASHRGEGKVREAALIFTSPSVRVHLFADGFDRLPAHKDLSELISLSPKLGYLSAFQDEEENYVVHVKDVGFLRGFELYVSPAGRVRLKRAFVVVDAAV